MFLQNMPLMNSNTTLRYVYTRHLPGILTRLPQRMPLYYSPLYERLNPRVRPVNICRRAVSDLIISLAVRDRLLKMIFLFVTRKIMK